MSSKVLPILNTVGCLSLAVLSAIQWNGLRSMDRDLYEARKLTQETEQKRIDETARANNLTNDIQLLKDTIKTLQGEIEKGKADVAARDAELSKAITDQASFGKMTEEWKTAIAERDTRITELNTALQTARARLDEAIGRLKQANARAQQSEQ